MKLVTALRLTLDPHRPDVVALVGAGGKSAVLFRLAQEILAGGGRVITTTTTQIFTRQLQDAPAHLRLGSGPLDWAALARALEEHGHCLLVRAASGEKADGLSPEQVDELVRGLARRPELGVGAVLVEADGSRQRPVKAPAPHEPVLPRSTTLLAPLLGLEGLGRRLAEPWVHRPQRLRALLGVEGAEARLTPALAARLLTHPAGGAKGRRPGMAFRAILNQADNAPRLASGRLVASLLAWEGEAALLAQAGHPDREPVRERWGPTAAVVLAGGEGRRMGRPKQLLELAGEPLVVRAAWLALESGATQAVVVLGAQEEAIRPVLAGLAQEAGGRLRLVSNPAWAQGQSTSLRAAMQALSPGCQAVLFLPVDQPLLPVALLRRLWRLWREGHDRVAPAVAGEVRGAPAVFDRRFWPELQAVQGDRGARDLLRGGDVASVPVPAGWLQDVDTPEQWRRLRAGMAGDSEGRGDQPEA